jgi:hypothetical protein
MKHIRYVRVVRTSSSERILLHSGDRDIGALDLHYGENDRVFAMLVLLEEAAALTEEVESLVTEIDDLLLPGASREEGSVVFTVVVGKIIGSYTGQKRPDVD